MSTGHSSCQGKGRVEILALQAVVWALVFIGTPSLFDVEPGDQETDNRLTMIIQNSVLLIRSRWTLIKIWYLILT